MFTPTVSSLVLLEMRHQIWDRVGVTHGGQLVRHVPQRPKKVE